LTLINFKLELPEQYYQSVFSNELWPQSFIGRDPSPPWTLRLCIS